MVAASLAGIAVWAASSQAAPLSFKVALTGAKLDKKFYYHQSGIPGGKKSCPMVFAKKTKMMKS